MPVPPATVSPVHTQPPPTDRESERTSSVSPEASQPRATPNFSRPLPRSPTDTAPPGNTGPSTTGPVTGFSRPLPSVPDALSHQGLEYTHGGRGSGLGMRIIDDRDPDDDFVIPGPTLRQHQSRSPVLSYEEDGRTSSAATDSELLYASAPSTPLRTPLELRRETDTGRSSPSESQTTHEAARRGIPERRATMASGESRHDFGEGSLTPRRAATADYYSRVHSQQETPVPAAPQSSQHHSTYKPQHAPEHSDDMDPYPRKLVERFDDDDTPKFPGSFAHQQTLNTPHFPEPQPHLPPLVLDLPVSDPQVQSSPHSDETVVMPVPFAFPLPLPVQRQDEGAWKSYASSSLNVGPALISSDVSRRPPPLTSVIAGTDLEFEPLQSPLERTDSNSSPTPHVETPRYAHDSPTHARRPLPPFPSNSTQASQERIGSSYGDEGESHDFVEPGVDDRTPLSVTGIPPVAPLRIVKHTAATSSTTPIPPGAAAPTPPAPSSADVDRIKENLGVGLALPVPSSSSPQKQQFSPSKGSKDDATEPISGSSSPAGITSAKDSPTGVQNPTSGVHSPLSSGPPAHAKPDPPRPTSTTSTGSDGALSRAQDQSAISGTPSKVASKETNLTPSEEVRRTPVDHPSRKPGNAQTTRPEASHTKTQDELPKPQRHSQPPSQRPQGQSQPQPQLQKHSPGPPSNVPPPPSQSKPPPPVPKSQPSTQSNPTSDTTPSGSHKRTSSAETPKQYRTLAEEKAQYNAVPPSSRTQYMQMLLALDDIPMIYDLSASFFTWILLAGFILFPGTFTSLQTLNSGTGFEAVVVNRIVNLPLFVVAFMCTGIGVSGMGYLWWRWMKNYIWLTNKIFMPGLMNSLAGIISTLSSVYGVQRGEFTTTSIITISVTGGVGAVCGILVLFYGVWMLGRVKKQHVREVGIEKAGKHGEGVWAGFKEKVGKVGKRI